MPSAGVISYDAVTGADGQALVRVMVYDRQDGYDESDMYVVEFLDLGVEVTVRRRTDDTTYVRVDSSDIPAEWRPLCLEVNNGGENTYS